MYRKNLLKDKGVFKVIIIINKTIPSDKDDVTLDVDETESKEETV